MFSFSKTLSALAALSLVTVSSAAVAQSAQPLSLANSPTVQRTGADVGQPSELRGRRGLIVPIIAAAALLLAILALTDTWPFDDDDGPESP